MDEKNNGQNLNGVDTGVDTSAYTNEAPAASYNAFTGENIAASATNSASTNGVTEGLKMADAAASVNANNSAPAKKKKTGLIVGIVCAVVALIGCAGVAAYFVIRNNSPEYVLASAVSKLFSDEAPKMVHADVVADVSETGYSENEYSAAVTVDFDRTTLSHTLTASYNYNPRLTLDLNEAYLDGDGIYLNLPNLSSLLAGVTQSYPINDDSEDNEDYELDYDDYETDCDLEDADCMEEEAENCEDDLTNCLTEMTDYGFLYEILSAVDGKWFKISSEDIASLTESDVFTCYTDAAKTLLNNPNLFKADYDANPFLTAENAEAGEFAAEYGGKALKANVDKAKLATFLNAAVNSGFFDSFYACAGTERTADAATFTAEKLEGVPTTVYVEVKDADFVHIKYNTTTSDAASDDDEYATVTTTAVDVSLSYPTALEITAPEGATSLTELFSTLFGAGE